MKVKRVEYFRNIKATDIVQIIERANFEIKPVTKHHLATYAALKKAVDHKDPADHVIIAQAISDKIPLISSDNQFTHYTSQGLRFVFNRR